jgi:predicted transporter
MATALALAASVPTYAQGCAMCYNDAAAAKSTAIQALRSGTLILLVPVLFLFAGILVMAFRSRNRFNEAEMAVVPASSGLGDVTGETSEWGVLLRAPELEFMVRGDERPAGR